MRMSRLLAVGLVLYLTGLSAAPASFAETPMQTAARDVETAFRDTMEMWAYREFWRLWDLSTEESRFSYTQNDFAALMERGTAKPATGRRIEELRISITSPKSAVVLARIGLEDPNTNTTQSIVRSFLFYYEGGRWRPQLSDFLGLSSYSFPSPPPFGAPVFIAPCCPARVFPHPVRKLSPPAPTVPKMTGRR